MNYKKNEDGTYTVYRLMKDTNTTLEATASTLDDAKERLKIEHKDYKAGYGITKTRRKFYSPGAENDVAYVWARHDLADVIDKEVGEELTKQSD